MPTYDYQCDKCEHTWELFQSITAEPIKKCPECGAKKARRIIGPGAGIIFKGSGFYQTDYRSDSYQKAAAADKKSNQETKAASESKSESSSSSSSSTSKTGTNEKKSSD